MGRLKAEQRRTQLMEVATRLFAERGFDATTTAAIAAAAGVSEPILYRHFRSKRALFAAIVSEVTRTTQEHWRRQMAGIGDPAEAFRVISAEWPQHMRACRLQYHVIHNALVSSRDPVVISLIREHYTQMEAFLAGIVEEGQRTGVFRKNLDIKTSALWIMHGGIGFTLMGLTLGEMPGYDIQTAINLTLRALLNR
ncbi:MAG: TetR/AcrR family transcriptional regulator [Tepidisphaerales bacterium]